MRYDYICNDCSNDEKWFVFEINHGMNETPEIKCPECGKCNTEKVFLTVPVTYVRGYGWLDVSGRRRDMNLWKLKNDDPYASMRQSGEAADLAHRLKKGGEFNKKSKTYSVDTKTSKTSKSKLNKK